MKIKQYFPVSVIAGIVASLYTGFAVFFGLNAIWVAFISWPMHLMAGGKPKRLHKAVFGLTGGMILAWLMLLLSGPLTAFFSLPVALGIIVFFFTIIIVMLELTEWFEMAGAYFLSFAGFLAYVFGGFGGPAAFTNPTVALLPYWLLLMLGLVLASIISFLRKVILEKQGIFGAAQQTVFDKEKPE